MKFLLKWLLILVNLACSLALLGSILSQYFDPSSMWPLSFLGLGFPVLLIINILFLAFWALQWKKPAWISLLVLILAIPAIMSSYRFFSADKSSQSNQNTLTVLSYNVRLFDVFNWSGKPNQGKELLQFLGSSDSDVICLQEFMTNDSRAYNLQSIFEDLSQYPFHHIAYNYQAYKRKHGLAIFSKYPIIHRDQGEFPGTRNMFVYADIKLPNDTVRVFNAHLESIHLDQKQYSLIDTLNFNGTQTHREEYRQIISSIRQAFRKRAEQARILKEETTKSQYPVLICGDFNDTPVSYAYKTLKKGLKDSFTQAGKGMGSSFKEFKLPLRIDYILHDDEQMKTLRHEVIQVSYSDHYPIQSSIQLAD